ncbi:class I SAM-dependent methyltransferase [bacterium CPR1]|nr:class I SAM-dependent methyltransferase [bacterium CPR1]
MSHSTVQKLLEFLGFCTRPRSSLSCLRRGLYARDRVFILQTYWFRGDLPRVSLTDLVPDSATVDICLPRGFDRKFGTSLTAEEACHVCALVRVLKAQRVLEIGTFDGNTTLALAANLSEDGQVVTVDLPPDFDSMTDKTKLLRPGEEVNLTPRSQLGRQFQGHPLARRIKQVHADSATLDWSDLGGPFDLVFIDGCHSAPYVRSDSLNALQQVKEGGAILWHDYGMTPDVSSEVDRLSREMPGLRVRALEGTRLALALI